jgi:hypothetical protein
MNSNGAVTNSIINRVIKTPEDGYLKVEMCGLN